MVSVSSFCLSLYPCLCLCLNLPEYVNERFRANRCVRAIVGGIVGGVMNVRTIRVRVCDSVCLHLCVRMYASGGVG